MTTDRAILILKSYRENLVNSVSTELTGDIKAFDLAINCLYEKQIADEKKESKNRAYAEEWENRI